MPEHDEQNQEAEQMSLGTLSAMESTQKSAPATPKNPQNNLNTPLSAYGEPSVSQTAEPYPNLCKNLLFGGAGSETYQNICSEAATETGVDFSPLTIIPNSSQADAADAKAMLVGDEIHYATGMFCMDAPESVEIFRHEVQHYIQQKKGQVESTNLSANQNPALEKSAENAEKGDFNKGAEGTNTLTNEEIAQHKPTKPFDLNAPTAKSPTSTKKLYVYGTDAIIVDSTTNEAWYLENADRNVHSLQHFEENRTAWTPFSAEDYKVCKMTPPANLSATATPPETDTSTQKSEYSTKELIAPFAKVLAPEQMAELESLLDAIHPDKQNQDATLTASSNQMLALPLFPLIVPAIIAAAEGLWLGYTAVVVAVEVTTVVVASVAVAEIIKEMLSVDLPEVVVEAERSKPTVVPTPTGTDFKGWLPWSVYIPKETSKPQSEKPKSEKPKSEKPKAKRPKKDPKKPSGDGLLPSIGLGGMIANELYKNQNKQESPKADLALDKEIEELEQIPFKDRTPKDHMRLEDLRNKKMREEREQSEEALQKELDDLRSKPTTPENTARIKELEKQLAKVRKQKELFKELNLPTEGISFDTKKDITRGTFEVGKNYVGNFTYKAKQKTLELIMVIPDAPQDLRGLGILSETYKRLFKDFDVQVIKSKYMFDNAASFRKIMGEARAAGKKMSEEEAILETFSGKTMVKNDFELKFADMQSDSSVIRVEWQKIPNSQK